MVRVRVGMGDQKEKIGCSSGGCRTSACATSCMRTRHSDIANGCSIALVPFHLIIFGSAARSGSSRVRPERGACQRQQAKDWGTHLPLKKTPDSREHLSKYPGHRVFCRCFPSSHILRMHPPPLKATDVHMHGESCPTEDRERDACAD